MGCRYVYDIKFTKSTLLFFFFSFSKVHGVQQGIIHQLPPQLSNMGMGMTPPYPRQQGGKFGGPRRTTVKITHPDTHEELRLDKRADSYSDGGSLTPRSLPNMPPQSQPIPSFAPSHPLNFYNPNSFNAGSMFSRPQSSVPLTSSQLAPNSQAPRFNYPVGQNPQNMVYMNPSALNSLPVTKTRTPMHVTADLPKHEGEDAEIIGGGLAPLPASGAKDKPILDQNKAKIISKATKKKKKKILLKANAAGTTSDLYNAYKGPEEKKETILSTDYTESISTCVNEKQAPADAKKYSRDFLLKFSKQCSDLPEDFGITSDIGALMSANLNISHLVERDSYPSPGRIVDRPSGGSRLDSHGSSSSSMGEEDRWGRLPGHFAIRDVRLDPVPVYGGNTGFRLDPGGNYGVLKNPHGQAPMQYPGG